MKILKICLYTAMAIAPIYASAFNTFSGEVFLTTGFTSSNSNLNPNNGVELNSLNGNSDSTVQGFIAPLGSISYSLNHSNTHRVYLGTSRDDLAVGTLAFEIGYQRDLTSGTQIDFAYLPTVMSGEVWSDPYLLNEKRTTTDISGNTYRLKLSNLWNTQVSLDMAYANAELEQDKITHQSLMRDSDTYYMKGQYMSLLSLHSGLISSFSLTNHKAKGSAASYNQYDAEVTYFQKIGHHAFAATSSYAYRQFDEVNPIFNKLRSDDVYSLFLAYEYSDIANWSNWGVASFIGTTVNSSNIGFYDSVELLASVGINYKF